MTKIHVIMEAPGRGRFSERVATWVLEYLSAHGSFDVQVVDLRDYPLAFFDQAPAGFILRDYPNKDVARLGRKLDEADGFVVLTAEYTTDIRPC